jgi:hypothetical protein
MFYIVCLFDCMKYDVFLYINIFSSEDSKIILNISESLAKFLFTNFSDCFECFPNRNVSNILIKYKTAKSNGI